LNATYTSQYLSQAFSISFLVLSSSGVRWTVSTPVDRLGVGVAVEDREIELGGVEVVVREVDSMVAALLGDVVLPGAVDGAPSVAVSFRLVTVLLDSVTVTGLLTLAVAGELTECAEVGAVSASLLRMVVEPRATDDVVGVEAGRLDGIEGVDDGVLSTRLPPGVSGVSEVGAAAVPPVHAERDSQTPRTTAINPAGPCRCRYPIGTPSSS